MSDLVHWHEGLFLQQHHLQALQRLMTGTAVSERRLAWPYPYGAVEMRLSADALENHTIRFDRLRAVMPSGLEVDFPASADLPALDIKRAFEAATAPFQVSLGVPLWYAARGNAMEPGGAGGGDDWRMKRLYRVAEVQRPDENTGENPQPLLVRRINARLLLPDDDRSDLEVLPLLRIVHATGQDVGLPRQDPGYAPPCLVLGGSVVLRDLVRDLANQVEASRGELARQLGGSGFSMDTLRGAQLEQLLRLRTLNRFTARLPHLARAPSVSPFTLYLELRELLGELAALHPDHDPFDVADYDHDNPLIAFAELDEAIRPYLRGAVKGRFAQLPFVRDGGILVCALNDDQLRVPNEYFLGIRTKEDPRGVAALVEDPDKFKLMARSMARQAVWGVRLAEERHPPLQLPAEVGLSYFRLLRAESTRMWEQVKKDHGLAIRWRDLETSDFNVTLYMTIPEP